MENPLRFYCYGCKMWTIDVSEKTSVSAAIPPVIGTTGLTDDSIITFSIIQIGSTIAGTGLKVTIIGNET